jgi:hypothetical protein
LPFGCGQVPLLAGRRLIAAACSVPLLSLVPRAAMHLPWAMACEFATARLAYVVLSLTWILVWEALPLESVVAATIVLPVTELTLPPTPPRPRGC